MCSCTPKISCTTSTTGSLPPFSGIARYAGTGPVMVGIFTSPATSPAVSVVIVVEAIGCTILANPCGSNAVTRSRRLVSGGDTPRSTDSAMGFPSELEVHRLPRGVERRLYRLVQDEPAAANGHCVLW